MVRTILAGLIILATCRNASAEWLRYWENKDVAASYNVTSFAQFRNQPSVWVKWDFISPTREIGGEMIQLTADCRSHRMFELSIIPYDRNGNFQKENKHYDAPKEYPVSKDALNEATYKLLCH